LYIYVYIYISTYIYAYVYLYYLLVIFHIIGEHLSTSICSANDMLHLVHSKNIETVSTDNKDVRAPLISLFSFYLYMEMNDNIQDLERDILKPGGKMVHLSSTQKRRMICDSKLISILYKILKNKKIFQFFLKNQLKLFCFEKNNEFFFNCFTSQLSLRLLINVDDGNELYGDNGSGLGIILCIIVLLDCSVISESFMIIFILFVFNFLFVNLFF
jgi:hypothetical protein